MSQQPQFVLTKEIALKGLQAVEDMVDTICLEKYCIEGEKTKQDVLDRVTRVVIEKGKEFGYPDIEAAASIIKDGYFLPGGSILAGLGNDNYKSSLSNCYFVPIKNDSIEAIFDAGKEMARTYSYRGGCGTDITVLRPCNDQVSNAAKKSSGSISFMEFYSTVTGIIGQCLAYDSLVLTQKGLKEIRHVEIGEPVWTAKGWVKVLNVIKNTKQTYKLTTNMGYNLRASEDHVFKSLDVDNYEMIEKPLKEFKEKDPIMLVTGTTEHSQDYQLLTSSSFVKTVHAIKNQYGTFESKEANRYLENVTVPNKLDEKLAYLLGFSYGNGSVEYNKQNVPTGLSVSCSHDYPQVESKLLDITKSVFNYTPTVRPGDGAVNRFDIGRAEVCSFLKENGLLKQKAKDLEFPAIVMDSPMSVKCAFISGFFDADGFNGKNKSGYRFTTICRSFINSIQIVLMSLGMASRLHVAHREEKGWNDLYNLTVTGRYSMQKFVNLMIESEKVKLDKFVAKRDSLKSPYTAKGLCIQSSKFEYIPSDGYLSIGALHKYDPDFNKGMLITDRVKNITNDEVVDTYDLQLESEHLFWCNGIYVHNSGRRGALMLTMDCRHPDIMKFIWSKADPARVFPEDPMSPGQYPIISKANISVKWTDEFMHSVKNNYDTPWKCEFPDIEQDKEFYNKNWSGDLDDWVARGGKVKKYKTHTAIITKENKHLFVGRKIKLHDNHVLFSTTHCHLLGEQIDAHDLRNIQNLNCHKIFVPSTRTIEITKEILEHIEINKEYEFLNPTPRQLFQDFSTAAWLRGDPGAMFIDHVQNNSFTPMIHPTMKVRGSNPCSEIPLSDHGNCLLGAHVLHKYVKNAWWDDASFDFAAFVRNCKHAVTIMNVISDANEELHPLNAQIKADKFSKRIGIEFVGLTDMTAMLNCSYGSDANIKLIRDVMSVKAYSEFKQSNELARLLGPCKVLDPKYNKKGINILLESEYYQNLMKHMNPDYALSENIKKYGLRNSALNTVGPTGSLSLLAGNCSSGIEPIFSIHQRRRTRVGDVNTYDLVHAPLIRHLLSNKECLKVLDNEGYTIQTLKYNFFYQEASEIDHDTRIRVQAEVQKWTDGAISSTINLPSKATSEDILNIYINAWEKNLKGITVFRNGSLQGVISSLSSGDSESNNTPEFGHMDEKLLSSIITNKTLEQPDSIVDFKKLMTEVQPVATEEEIMGIMSACATQLANNEIHIREMRDVEKCIRHRVIWNKAKVYVMVTLDDLTGKPVEVFATLPKDVGIDSHGNYNDQMFQEKQALWEVITRLTSLALRANLPLSAIIKQLSKSTYSINDPMSILIRVLTEYDTALQLKIEKVQQMEASELEESEYTSICPKCHQKTYVNEGGCGSCYSPECGFTRCS